MSENFLNYESVDIRGIASTAFTTDIPALVAAALAVRTRFNTGTVERLIAALQDAANYARELHL